MTDADSVAKTQGQSGKKVPTPEEISAILEDPKAELWQRTSRCVFDYTVALLTIPTSSVVAPAPAGTGTLVRIANSHYILTAAHVWEERLQSSRQVGLTLTPDIDHCSPIETSALAPFTLPNPGGLQEWGPDIVLLKIPAFLVGGIEAIKSFYPVDKDKRQRKLAGVEYRFLAGAPGDFVKIAQLNTQLNVTVFLADLAPLPYTRGKYDYIDLKENVSLPGYPKTFKGVSGGGLWRVQVFGSADTGEVDWSCFLEGLAFYQLPAEDAHVIVRCHGEQTIQLAIRELL